MAERMSVNSALMLGAGACRSAASDLMNEAASEHQNARPASGLSLESDAGVRLNAAATLDALREALVAPALLDALTDWALGAVVEADDVANERRYRSGGRPTTEEIEVEGELRGRAYVANRLASLLRGEPERP